MFCTAAPRGPVGACASNAHGYSESPRKTRNKSRTQKLLDGNVFHSTPRTTPLRTEFHPRRAGPKIDPVASTTTSLPPSSVAQIPPNPLVLWHLLSLDAPTVACLWTWFLAHTAGLALPPTSIVAMFVAVWILYAADRLLDARPLGSGALGTRPLEGRPVLGGLPPDSRRPNTDTSQPHTHRLEARHLFHHRHRPGYLGGILVAALTLSSLAPRLLPSALHLYLVEGALLVAWFLVLHATPFARPLPKEFVVGIFFAAAAFIPTVARRPELRLALAPSALLFAALCTLNGLFIHAWEALQRCAARKPSHPPLRRTPLAADRPHRTARRHTRTPGTTHPERHPDRLLSSRPPAARPAHHPPPLQPNYPPSRRGLRPPDSAYPPPRPKPPAVRSALPAMTSTSLPDFDRLARPYRLLEYLTFGPALQRTRLRFLPELTTCRRALILGDGDGRFTAALLAANPHLHARAVDLSPAMLRLLTRRAHAAHPTAAARLHTQAADALTLNLPPHQAYDLIATHFFLDCFTQPDLDRLCARLHPHLAPDAVWLLSDFHIPAGPLRLPARLLIRSLYLAFRVAHGPAHYAPP